MGKSKGKKGKSKAKKGKSKAKKGNPEKPDKSGETSLRKNLGKDDEVKSNRTVVESPNKSGETSLRKNLGKDDEVKSNRTVVESPKVEMGDEGESMNKEEKSDKPGIDGKMGGDREVKKASFKNDKGKRKLEDTAVVMEKEVIASESVEVELCPICFEDVPEAEDERFTVDGCFHKVCVACMTQYLSSYVLQQRKSLICPKLGCKCELQTEDCNMIVGPDQMALMKQLKAEAKIDFAHRVYCPNPRCSLLMSARELRVVDAALPGARQCLRCGSRFCINCKMEWHKKMTCSEFQKTKAYKRSDTAVFDAVARELGLKKCRKCHSTVERAEGCKHMTCTFCKFEFCYSCGNEWIKRKPTRKCATKVDK